MKILLKDYYITLYMEGYLLCYHYNTSKKKWEDVIVKVKTIDGKSTIKYGRFNSLYEPTKTNVLYVVDITNMCCEKIDSCYLKKYGKNSDILLKTGNIIKFKNYDLDNDACLSFYSTRQGAMNHSRYVPSDFDGTIYHYYPNGMVKEKHLYDKGKLITTYGLYNNTTNSINYIWQFTPTKENYEYIYDQSGNNVIHNIISNGEIKMHLDYGFQNNCYKSIYLKILNNE